MTELEKLDAGVAVMKDVPDNCAVGGVPAKVIRENDGDTEENKQ